MQFLKPAGRVASAQKYDVLTALGAYALAQDKTVQRRALRLMTLITARYNWSRDLLAVGQREIAQLWSVDERTVKREMARLRADGWLGQTRAGARGRVAEYALGLDALIEVTQAQWACVGPDYDLRMRQQNRIAGVGQAAAPDVMPMPVKGHVPAPDLSSGTEWALASALIHRDDPALYGAWVRGLTREGRSGGCVTLRAPSQFHGSYVLTHLMRRIEAACSAVDSSVTEVRLIV